MKEKSILVFVPDNLDFKQSGYLSGYKRLFECSEVYYITSNRPTKTIYQSVGFMGQTADYIYNKLTNEIPLFINSDDEQILLKDNLENKPITQIIYDYKRFKNSDIVYNESENYGQHFKYLSKDLRKTTYFSSTNGRSIIKSTFFIIYILNCLLNMFSKFGQVVQRSGTLTHFEESIISIKWFLNTILEERKITPKLGNAIVAKLIDLILGIVLTTYLLSYKEDIFNFIQFIIKYIISNLKGLLLYLMGQPIGLKLNYGFNNFLGQFFLYHISLWRIFLHGINPLFTSYFNFFVMAGIFGLSYQIAMISDIVSIATFHSYCIYIYAGRLFNLQLRCLTSLWRVLIGRKFNPLRNRVDSCQYSQNQLFIGTLSFTILLFLLPTTAIYYVVFSVFRLVTLFIDGLLLILRNLMCTIPVYSVFLWIVNSASVAGNVHVIWKSYDDRGNVKIEAKLERLPFITSIIKFMPDFSTTIKNQRTFGDIFNSSITGKIL